jgi:predicted phosphoadenosine phosphosulfate sulfurtransferase
MSKFQDTKQRYYIETDVLSESKKRINHIIDTFDKIFVSFSGGKDSLVTLHLVEEVFKERGIKDPVNVIFRDEELIPETVIDFVLKYMRMKDRFAFRYYAVPQLNYYFVLGELREYVQWDPNRKWMREKPKGVIESLGEYWDKNPVTQHNMNRAMLGNVKGKVALINGIRASESLTRYRSCLAKKNENYINSTDAKNVKFCKVIYDWSEDDVFKYLYDRKIKYCQIYDMQMFSKQTLRVATPVHKNAYRELKALRGMYPKFYENLINIWPEIDTQAKYWEEYDEMGILNKYEASWEGILRYCKERIRDQTMREKAIEQVCLCRDIRRRNARRTGSTHGRIIDERNFWGYPLFHVWKQVISGNYSRGIQAKSLDQINKADREYEQKHKEWLNYVDRKKQRNHFGSLEVKNT